MAEQEKLTKISYAVGIIVLALGLASYMFYSTFFTRPIHEMPNTVESASPYACTMCSWTGMLTARQQALQQMKGLKVERAAASDGEGTTSMRMLTLTCPGCQQIAARPANQCGQCQFVFAGDLCPKCESGAAKPDNVTAPHPAAEPVEEESRRT